MSVLRVMGRDGVRHLCAASPELTRCDVVPDRQRYQAATAAKARRARWDFERKIRSGTREGST